MRIAHLTHDDWADVDPRWMQRPARRVAQRLGRLVVSYRSYGRERIPAEGGFLMAPTHGSYLDPFYYAYGTDRTVRFMAKHESLEWPVAGRLIRWCGGFPVRPGHSGRDALEIARHVVDAGNGLLIFMEGRIIREPSLGPPRKGLAVLALTTGVPVVPVAAWGNKSPVATGIERRWWQRRQVTLVWGEPMSFPREERPSDQRIEAVRDEIWAEVARLHELARERHPERRRIPRVRARGRT